MPSLPEDVTLVCIDCVNVERAISSVDACLARVPFKHVKLLTSLPTNYPHAVKIRHLGSIYEYCVFCMRELADFFTTSHCLIVQHDGWIIDPTKWDDSWLQYDYLGCVTWWTDPGPEGKGGNGGFCLRSRRLVEKCSLLTVGPSEDIVISSNMQGHQGGNGQRALLESHGMSFAPRRVQEQFGMDHMPYTGQFGGHCAEGAPLKDSVNTSHYFTPIQFKGVSITGASYGWRDRTMSAKRIIEKALQGPVVVSNSEVGDDPCYNLAKSLRVSFTRNGKRHTHTLKEGAALNLDDLLTKDFSENVVWAPWRFNLGDHWATVNYLLTLSWATGEEILLSRYQHGHDYKARFEEILDLLNPPERACVRLVDEAGTREPDGFAVWSAPFWPTKRVWNPLAGHGHCCYQFDGISSAEDKNPPSEDIPRILDAIPGLYFPLSKNQTLKECVELLAGARLFVGCDSGMSHLAHSVGVPMVLVEYELPIITTHRYKRFAHARGTDECIKAIKTLT